MPDSFVETSSSSWFGRIGGAAIAFCRYHRSHATHTSLPAAMDGDHAESFIVLEINFCLCAQKWLLQAR